MSIIGKSLYASTFDPRMVPGCALWLDATDVTTMSLTGTNVTQWRDKSGNARHANPFCNAPTYSSAKQSIDFTPAQGLNSSLIGPTTDTGTPESAFIVVTFSNVGTAIRNTLLGGRGLFGRMYDASSTFLEIRMDGSTNAPYHLASASLTTGKKYLCFFQYAFAKEISTFNNVLSATGGAVSPFTARTTTIGLANGGASGLRGSLHEILVYSNTLTTIDKLQIGGYLAWKWNVTTDICVGHPYKYTTPLLRPFIPLDVDANINVSCNAHWFDAADTTEITSSGTTLTVWSNIVDNRNDRSDISGISGIVSTGTKTQNGNNLIILPSNTNISFLGRFFSGQRTRFIATRPTLNTTLSNVQFLNQDLSAGSGNDYLAIESSTMVEKAQGVRTQLQTATIANQSNQFSIYAFGHNSGIPHRVALTGVPQTLTTSNSVLSSYNTNTNPMYINGVGSQELGEWISINDTLEVSDAQRIEGYLAWKWGIVNDLSTTHPFKLFPPLSIQFNPKQIANCSLWLDAADPSTVTLTGNVVTSLKDKGNRGLTFSNGVGFTYNVTKFNGSYPSFYNSTSSGANILGVGTSASSFALTQACFFVGNRNSIVASNYLFQGDTIVRASTTSSGSNLHMAGGTSGTITLTNANQFRSPFIGYFEFNATSSKGYINGSSNNSGTISNTGTTVLRIGNGTATPSLPWNGHICEIIMYDDFANTTINASNLLAQKVEGYLAHKWGLVNLLPVSHTYKKFRP